MNRMSANTPVVGMKFLIKKEVYIVLTCVPKTSDYIQYIYIYIFSDCFLGKPLLLSQNPWNHLWLNQVRVKQEPAVDTLTLGIAKGQFQNLGFDPT